jgi:hypothetical protein
MRSKVAAILLRRTVSIAELLQIQQIRPGFFLLAGAGGGAAGLISSCLTGTPDGGKRMFTVLFQASVPVAVGKQRGNTQQPNDSLLVTACDVWTHFTNAASGWLLPAA